MTELEPNKVELHKLTPEKKPLEQKPVTKEVKQVPGGNKPEVKEHVVL